ncbi:AraC family transcriptional regulator [Andreprevotia chitinilytica]|uniref:AraC family transcriptional regulator n=1 Tax=Andreprevotia chitinilytica TaxID=396808 RepID=UPI0014700AF9|nr:AraC family transcriptional regulator [Andreprevotia chitinilytica]
MNASLSPRQLRLYSLMDHIEVHLDAPMPLDDMARRACYSPSHFDRVFGDLAGWPPGDYLRRRRLLRSAARVRHERTPVLQIALESGFSSDTSFAKCFKQFFGFSARDWRQGAWADYMAHNQTRWDALWASLEPVATAKMLEEWAARESYRVGIAQQVIVRELPPQPVLYRRSFGEWGYGFDRTWGRISADCEALGLDVEGRTWFGCISDDTGFVIGTELQFDYCLSYDGPPVPTMARRTLPGGVYACLPFDYRWPKFQWMYEDWLERQNVWVFDGTRPHMDRHWSVGGVEGGELLLPVRRA